MVSKKLALNGILSSGDKLFDSSIKVASILQGELQDLLNRATLLEEKQKLEKSTSKVDELLSQLGTKRSDLEVLLQSLEDDAENANLSAFETLESDCNSISEDLPKFDGFEEILVISGNMNDEVAMLKQHVVTIKQILSAVTELTRLFRFVSKNV